MKTAKNTSKAKILRKIALFTAILILGVFILSGCASALKIDTEKSVEDWKTETIEFTEDRGVLDTVLSWLGTLIDWFTVIVPWQSYILALFVFAIVIELLMLPFGIKQQRNSIKQAKLRPKEMAIRKRYAGRTDQKTQQKISQEIQELYQQALP